MQYSTAAALFKVSYMFDAWHTAEAAQTDTISTIALVAQLAHLQAAHQYARAVDQQLCCHALDSPSCCTDCQKRPATSNRQEAALSLRLLLLVSCIGCNARIRSILHCLASSGQQLLQLLPWRCKLLEAGGAWCK